MKLALYVVGSIVFTLFLAIVCLMIGMNIGGNFFTSFEFLGNRGYEATGLIGIFIGILLGVIISIIGYFFLFSEQEEQKTPLR